MEVATKGVGGNDMDQILGKQNMVNKAAWATIGKCAQIGRPRERNARS